MRTALDRKFGRGLFYVRNVARDCLPQSLFRGRLDSILAEAGRYDAGYLAWRVNYYNKLRDPIRPDSYMSTVGSIPMARSMYYYDLKEHARYFPRHFGLDHLFGDITFIPDIPKFTKTRPIAGDNRNSLIVNLNKYRNFYFPADPVPFASKRPIAVWRGSPHNDKRRRLVASHHAHPLCDIGFTQGKKKKRSEKQIKEFIRPLDQMAYRYIVSIEGKDMATNLKWILASNSVCFQPKPLYETWFMEGRLEAGRHYVELRDDFADLEDKIVYYEKHPGEAMEIVRNANEHVRHFDDPRRERLLSLLVLYKYFFLTGQMAERPELAALIRD